MKKECDVVLFMIIGFGIFFGVGLWFLYLFFVLVVLKFFIVYGVDVVELFWFFE